MANFAYGVTSIKAGGIDAVTGLPTSLADVGDVYENTAQLTQEDPTVTEHMSEFKIDPVAAVEKQGRRTFRFSLMDTSADTLVAWCGGTVTAEAEEPDIWNAPELVPVIEKSLEITTEDGTVITINRAKITAKTVGNPTKQGAMLIEVTARVMQPKVADVPSMTFTDPE